jgi:hypothetical protein
VKKGDMVRFKIWEVRPRNKSECGMWKVKIGLLIRYEKWEKIGEILCDGKVYRAQSCDIEKAGRKDYENA